MNKQYSTEQVEYQAAQYDNNAAMLEGYNPSEYDHDAPYIASGRYQQKPQQRQANNYYQNPGYQQPPTGYGYPNQGYPPQQNMQQINYQQEQMQRSQGPTYADAYKNLERYDNMLNNLGHVNVTQDGSDVQEYALGVAMESLHAAMKALREIEYWMPKGKEHLNQKFGMAATPIIKGLQAYLAAMERIQ